MFIYKIDFFDKKSDLRFKNLNNLIENIHRLNKKFYFALNSKIFNGEVFIISKTEINNLSVLEGVEKVSIIGSKRFDMILSNLYFFVKKNNNNLNKSSIKNFIKKNREHLEQNSYEDFIKSIGYNKPKEQHKIIYEEYKKNIELELILLNIQKKIKPMLDNGFFIQLNSLSTGQYFKIFLKEVNIKNINLLDFKEKNSFGLIDKNLNKF